MSDRQKAEDGVMGMRRPQLAVIVAGLLVVLWPTGLALAAGCATKPAPPCTRVVFAGSVGPRAPLLGCVRKLPICSKRVTTWDRRSFPGETGATGRTGARGAQGATGNAGPAGIAGAVGLTGATGLSGPLGPAGIAGALGLTGATGLSGPLGPAGVAGAVGLTGATGLSGPLGPAGVAGAVGLTGATGPSGPAGVTGADGPQGATGPAGSPGPSSSGLSQYAYIYNTGAEVVALDSDITFDTNGVLTPGITHGAGAAGIALLFAGAYKISFSVSGTEPSQMAIFVSGVPVVGTTYGSGAGTQQNSGQAIVVVGAGGVLTVRNHSSAAAVGLTTPIGGTQLTTNASVIVEKLD